MAIDEHQKAWTRKITDEEWDKIFGKKEKPKKTGKKKCKKEK